MRWLNVGRLDSFILYKRRNYHRLSLRKIHTRHRISFRSRRFSSNNSVASVCSDETIYALSTAPGKGAIAIVRASGPQCITIFNSLCPNSPSLHPRQATVCRLYSPVDPRIVVDSASVLLYYPAPSSATGEDVLELHVHGGSATQRAVLFAISNVASITKLPIRYAEPGEFTKRAFLNHKLELAQVEVLSHELSAETEQQRRAAVRSNPRKLTMKYESWMKKLLLARGEIEALIDFSEDQNFDESSQTLLGVARGHVDFILREIKRYKLASHRQELLKKGIKISLLGPPNSGKSSLLNRITGREASIVSQEAGTTRDVIEISLDVQGYLCTFADTAGLRAEVTSDEGLNNSMIGAVEQEGIRRAKCMAKKSDIVILMASFEQGISSDLCSIVYDHESLSLAANTSKNILIVVNKHDKVTSTEQSKSLIENFQTKVVSAFSPKTPPCVIPICCHDLKDDDDDNIQHLLSELLQIIQGITEFPIDMEDLIGVTERQRLILETFSSHLEDFKAETKDVVLASEHLRLAARCLAKITGRGEEVSDVEEILGVIFEKFCIGK